MDNFGRSERRLAWIEACLRFTGRFGIREKKAYRHRFSLTDGMVSRDQDAFVGIMNARCGAQVVTKECGKLVIAEDAALPASPMLSPPPKTTDWLGEVLGAHYEVVEPIHRAEPMPSILRGIVEAIIDKHAIRFSYQPRHGDRGDRLISPHTIVHAVGRLHVRGWDHGRNAPRDFVLTRITAISRADELQGYVGQEYDREWHEEVVLEVRLRAGENLDAVRPDYGLGPSGYSTRKVRRAHAGYLVDGGMFDRQHALRSSISVKLKNE